MTAPNTKALIGEVAKRHGITLRADDPAFALVTLNQLVLEEMVMSLGDQTRQMAREFEEKLNHLQIQIGAILGGEIRDALSALRQSAADSGARASDAGTQHVNCTGEVLPLRWLSAGLMAGLALFLLGVVLGKLWR